MRKGDSHLDRRPFLKQQFSFTIKQKNAERSVERYTSFCIDLMTSLLGSFADRSVHLVHKYTAFFQGSPLQGCYLRCSIILLNDCCYLVHDAVEIPVGFDHHPPTLRWVMTRRRNIYAILILFRIPEIYIQKRQTFKFARVVGIN